MQAFDHLPVQPDRAQRRLLGIGEGLHHPPRPGDLGRVRAEARIRRGNLVGMDQRLAVEAQTPPFGTFRSQPIGCVKGVAYAVQGDQPGAPGGDDDLDAQGQQRLGCGG